MYSLRLVLVGLILTAGACDDGSSNSVDASGTTSPDILFPGDATVLDASQGQDTRPNGTPDGQSPDGSAAETEDTTSADTARLEVFDAMADADSVSSDATSSDAMHDDVQEVADLGDAGSSDIGANPDWDAGLEAETNDAVTALAPAEAIALIRASAPSTDPVTVTEARVTYLKPLVSGANPANDPEGFFVQAGPLGPAVFVVRNATEPMPPLGANVRLDVTATEVNAGTVRVVAARVATLSSTPPADWDAWPQDLSAVDIVSNLGDYDAELVALTGRIKAAQAPAGAGYVSFQLETAGVVQSNNLRLRMPTAVATGLNLGVGCTVEIPRAPMWRFNAIAQPSVFSVGEVGVLCGAAPRLVSAEATSATSVTLTFDQPVRAATPAEFTIAPALAVLAASAQGATITLTTAEQQAGVVYTVTAETTVAGLDGRPIDAQARSAIFTGFTAGQETSLLINEVDYDQPGDDLHEFLEIYNPSNVAVTLYGTQLELYNQNAATPYTIVELEGQLPAGGYLVVGSQALLDTITDTGVFKVPFTKAKDNIQNGDKDAIALRRNGSVFAALCYERCPADFLGAPSPAAEDTGLGSLGRCPNGQTTGDNVTDFRLLTVMTPGTPNACPAP